MPRYAELAELKDRLGATDSVRDYAFESCLDAASRWVDTATGRRFYATVGTRYYTAHWHYPHSLSYSSFPWGNPERPGGGGYAAQHLTIDDFVSVSQVATDDDGDGTYETVWTAGTDYWLGPRNAAADGKPYRSVNRNLVTGRYRFPAWENGVSITGSAGYSATRPDEIRELCLMVAELLARPVLDMTIVGAQTYKLGDQLSVTMDGESLPPSGQIILQNYRDPIFFK